MADKNKKSADRLTHIAKAAEVYGKRSFDNYAQVRSLAETLRDELCAWLSPNDQCVFLVPSEGPFSAQNYRSGAYSVTGTGYLPLKPISFGLAVKISHDKDFMRLKLTCRKEGERMFISIDDTSRELRVELPANKHSLEPLFETIYNHILDYFQNSVDAYDNGEYGTSEIGFDIQRADD